MCEKIFERVAINDGVASIRLVGSDYLRADEKEQLIGTLRLMGATFVARLDTWTLPVEVLERLRTVLMNLNRQVEARSQIGYSASKERKRLKAKKRIERLSARTFKIAVFKARGSYCEACGGAGEVHYRIIPTYIAPVDAVENYRILCRSCQTRLRLSFNRRLAKELAKKDAQWLIDQYDEEVTRIVEGDDSVL